MTEQPCSSSSRNLVESGLASTICPRQCCFATPRRPESLARSHADMFHPWYVAQYWTASVADDPFPLSRCCRDAIRMLLGKLDLLAFAMTVCFDCLLEKGAGPSRLPVAHTLHAHASGALTVLADVICPFPFPRILAICLTDVSALEDRRDGAKPTSSTWVCSLPVQSTPSKILMVQLPKATGHSGHEGPWGFSIHLYVQPGNECLR